MKSLLLKGANWIMLIGLGLTAFGIYEAVTQRNLTDQPQPMAISALADYDGELRHVTISGGQLDLANTYEYTREKRGKVRSREYFTPVLTADGKPAYIMQFDTEPSVAMFVGEVKNTGLLKPSSGLPSKISEAYDAEFSGATYYMVDTEFKFTSMAEHLKMIGIFVVIFVVGFGLRKLLTRNSVQASEA